MGLQQHNLDSSLVRVEASIESPHAMGDRADHDSGRARNAA